MKRICSIIACLSAALVTLVAAPLGGVTPPANAMASDPAIHAYIYDGDLGPGVAQATQAERSPPGLRHGHTAYDAVGHRPHRVVLRADGTAPRAIHEYKRAEQVVVANTIVDRAIEPIGKRLRALVSFHRLQVAANAGPSAQQIIQSTARTEAGRGVGSLRGALSPAERAAMDADPSLTSRMLGQAVHRRTAGALEEADPGRFWYQTRGPDFVDRTTGEMLELTTPGQVGAYLARPGYANVTMCTYVLPTC